MYFILKYLNIHNNSVSVVLIEAVVHQHAKDRKENKLYDLTLLCLHQITVACLVSVDYMAKEAKQTAI